MILILRIRERQSYIYYFYFYSHLLYDLRKHPTIQTEYNVAGTLMNNKKDRQIIVLK